MISAFRYSTLAPIMLNFIFRNLNPAKLQNNIMVFAIFRAFFTYRLHVNISIKPVESERPFQTVNLPDISYHTTLYPTGQSLPNAAR